MMETWDASGQHLAELMARAKDTFRAGSQDSEETRLPASMRGWLGRLRLLYGVPFEYLVPNDKLLPIESIRFFYIDRSWTDRLVDGALSVGKTSTREYLHHYAVDEAVSAALDNEERVVRLRLRNKAGDQPGDTRGGDLTGLLLRSAVVSGWPGLGVKAYGDAGERQLTLLRMDSVAPDTLLCIFEGRPTRVLIEEPPEAIQFGVDVQNPTPDGFPEPTEGVPSGFTIQLRYVSDQGEQKEPGGRVVDEHDKSVPRAIPVRRADRRVVHFKSLHAQLAEALPAAGVDLSAPDAAPGTPPGLSAAELAVQMLQLPWRQIFEGEERPAAGERPAWPVGTPYMASTFAVRTVVAPLSPAETTKLFSTEVGPD